MEKLRIPVEEFTTPDPIVADEETSVVELKNLMAEYGVRHIPIMRNGTVVGIISDRDLRVIASLDLKEKLQIKAGEIMARDPVTVNSEATLDQVAFEMSQKKIGSVIVNEGNRFLGIFTVTDALNALIEIIRSNER